MHAVVHFVFIKYVLMFMHVNICRDVVPFNDVVISP